MKQVNFQGLPWVLIWILHLILDQLVGMIALKTTFQTTMKILNSDDTVRSYEASSDGEVWQDVEFSDEHRDTAERTQSSDEVCDTVERSESSD